MLSKKKLNLNYLEQYRLPIYNRKSKDKIVTFYVLDPESVLEGNPRLKRIRKRFSHIHSAKERDEAALRFRDEVARKLRTGWNPLIKGTNSKSFEPFLSIIEQYKKYLKKELKDNVVKEKTVIDYMSRIRQLIDYLSGLSDTVLYAYQFDRSIIESFLEYIYIEHDTTPRTRNNYLRWIRSFCTYAFEHGYLTENIADKISFLREDDKKRKPLTKSDLNKLKEYLQQKNPYFLAVCLMHYYTLIRPGELSALKLKDINVLSQTVFVSHEISKNRKDAFVTIPKKVLRMLVDLDYFSYPDTFYIFGQDFRPNEKEQDSRIFRDYWYEVRKALNWPMAYQFYSLKDTGITDAIDHLGLTVTKDQARHSSVQTTNKYVSKNQLTAHPEFKNYDGDL